MLLFILIIITAVIILVILIRPLKPISNWHHSFVGLQFSSQEMYKEIERAVTAREIPNVHVSRTSYSQGGIFSASREYLRVTRNEYVFDICAAPFGKDFFVSWWLSEKEPDLAAKIPIINTLLGRNPKYKSYYQMDTEGMFRGSIHGCVLDAIDQITTAKGIRGPSDTERLIDSKEKLEP